MSIKIIISYKAYGVLVNDLCKQLIETNNNFSAVYALPRGGLPIAVHISHHLNIPLINNLTQFNSEFKDGKLLVVDDIVDTGKTYDRFIEIAGLMNIDFYTATLYYKPGSEYLPDLFLLQTNDWIVFPWEKIEEKPSEYHQNIYSELFNDSKTDE